MIEPGCVVSLNSGGPLMTVSTVEGDRARCLWFDCDMLREAEFPVGTIAVTHDTKGRQRSDANFCRGESQALVR